MLAITTKSGTELEQGVKAILEYTLAQWPYPKFTDRIVIETGSIPHSHPVLTLNTRTNDPLVIYKVFVHEQFHWYADASPRFGEALEYLKEKYADLGDCNQTGRFPNSFWVHLMVCWNTRNFLQANLSPAEVGHIYREHQVYPLTEPFVKDNFEPLRGDLNNFNLIYES